MKIGDVVEVVVEVVELTPKGRIVRLKCEARVDGKLVLDGEAVVCEATIDLASLAGHGRLRRTEDASHRGGAA